MLKNHQHMAAKFLSATYIKSAFCDSKTYDCAAEALCPPQYNVSTPFHTRNIGDPHLRNVVDFKGRLAFHIKVSVPL